MKFVKEHLSFILTIMVTYIIGICIMVIQFLAAGDGNFLKVLLDTMIPTTITYVYGCVLVNISDLLKEKADHYVINILTSVLITFYAFVFCIYVLTGYSFVWAFIEYFFTAVIIILNLLCYIERFTHRNHKLT